MGVEAWAQPGPWGLITPLHFYHYTICLCSENHPVFFWEPKFCQGEFGAERASTKRKKAKKGRKGSPAPTWAPVLTWGLF